MPELNPIFRAALEIQSFCERNRWRFCLIGGVAVQRWGEPRLTVDVDLTLLTGFGQEEGFVDRLLREFAGRRPDSREFALQSRVLLLQSSRGIPLDVALGAIPFEERTIERASRYDFGQGCSLTTCSAEDLIVHKCFAGRDKDWMDVDGILIRCKRQLNLSLIREELAPLLALKNAGEDMSKLESKIARFL